MPTRGRKSDDAKKKPSTNPKSPERRKVLKGGVVVGGAVVGSALTLPKKWTRPIVDAVIVPAHADMSPVTPTPAPTLGPTMSPTLGPTMPPTLGPTMSPTFI